MNIQEAFPSKYIKAADLNDQNVRVIMERVEMEDIGDDGDKPVLYFRGKAKGMVMNKTNSNNIAMVYGDETDDWVGKDLILYPTMVDYQGRSVPAIRVRAPQAKDRQASELRKANGPAPVRRPSVAQELNDEVPF
jgi:arabinogalactan endo-1,4-beta-galactosidase